MLVVVVIDAIADFLDINGAFARHFGVDDCQPVLTLRSALDEAIASLHTRRAASVVSVRSAYAPGQFRVPHLCTSEEGQATALRNLPVDALDIVKRHNSIFTALPRRQESQLLNTIAHADVLVCGVTTPKCIAAAVAQLQGRCRRVIVAEDLVAARASSHRRHRQLLDEWARPDTDSELRVVQSWRALLDPPQSCSGTLHYANGSIPSMRVFMMLYERDLAFETHRLFIMRRPAPTRLPDYLALNPRGQTPVLSVSSGGANHQVVHLRESLAILHHLDTATSASLSPSRALVLALTQESERLRLILDPLEHFFEDPRGLTLDGASLCAALTAIVRELTVWERYANESPTAFLAGTSQISMADCAFFPILALLVRRGLPVANGDAEPLWPALRAYFDTMITQSSVRRATPVGWHTCDEVGVDGGRSCRRVGINVWRRALERLERARDEEGLLVLEESLVRLMRPAVTAIHETTESKEPERLPYQCGVCAVEYRSAAEGIAHMYECHPIDEDTQDRSGEEEAHATRGPVFTPEYYACHGHCAERPLRRLGAGDSLLFFDVTSGPEMETETELFVRLRDEVDWQEMQHRGGAVPRLVAVQGTLEYRPDGSYVEPVYRHPADAQPQLKTWTPIMERLRALVSRRLGQPVNHALIQWYRTGTDYISEHADKTLDIAHGSRICNLSVGASRVMQMRGKRVRDGEVQERVGGALEKITLVDGSLFVLGWDTNLKMTHEIRQDKRGAEKKRPDELMCDGHRISITFRTVATFRRSCDGALFGQGSKWKHESDIVPEETLSTHHDDEETVRLIQAFSVENRSADFDWDTEYGDGFAVMNMREV